MRPSGRAADELRTVALEIDVNKHAEGSCMVRFGDTRADREPTGAPVAT